MTIIPTNLRVTHMPEYNRTAIQELNNAESSLNQRRFVDSMESAHSALEITSASGDMAVKAQILRFISRVNNIKGRYNNDHTLYEESLSHLDAALTLFPYQEGEYWDTLLEKGRTFLLKNDFASAANVFEKCADDESALFERPVRDVNLRLAISEFHYLKNEYDEAVDKAEEALSIVMDNDLDGKLLLEVYSQLVRVYLRRHEYGKILEYGNKTLELSRKYEDKEKEFVGLNAIAVYHGTKYDFKMAMLNFRNALDKSKEINYRYGTAYCLINIGTIYANLFNYNEALVRYTTVLEEYEDVLDESTGLIIMNNVGNIYFTVGNLDEALDYFQRALTMAESMNYTEMLAHTMAQVSRTLVSQKKYDEALEYAFKSEALIEDSDSIEGKQINYITLGNIYYKLGDFDLAMKYVGKGIVSSKHMKDTVSEIRGYRLMSNIFKEKGNYKKALDYQLIYSQAQERYAMDQRNRQIMDIEIRYDIQKKEQEIELLTKFKDMLISQRNKIAEQNADLMEINQELKQFAYVVSHDLKEPLRMIGSYSSLIQKRYSDALDESSGEFFGYVNEGVERMTKLLNDLLKYATVGRREEMEWEEVDLNEVLDATEFNLSLNISETAATINKVPLPEIISSRSLVSQLFQNLIGNALKFSKPDVPPVIDIGYELKDNMHMISFRDNGIGIPKESQERIFVIFQRLHKRSEYQGTGLGLSICMKIIRKLKGIIAVESEEGNGAVFTIGLPVDPPLPKNEKEEPFVSLDT